MYHKGLRLCIGFPRACEQACVGTLDASVLVCLRVCFCIDDLLSQKSPGFKRNLFTIRSKVMHDFTESKQSWLKCTVLMYIENIYFVLPAH